MSRNSTKTLTFLKTSKMQLDTMTLSGSTSSCTSAQALKNQQDTKDTESTTGSIILSAQDQDHQHCSSLCHVQNTTGLTSLVFSKSGSTFLASEILLDLHMRTERSIRSQTSTTTLLLYRNTFKNVYNTGWTQLAKIYSISSITGAGLSLRQEGDRSMLTCLW